MPYRIHVTPEARRLASAADPLGTRLLALDGTDHPAHSDACVAVEAVLPDAAQLPVALTAPGFDGGRIKVTALRTPGGAAQTVLAVARAGNGRVLGEVPMAFAAGSTRPRA